MRRPASSIGSAVRELREEAGLTVAALARQAKLDPATLTRIEAEERTNVRFATVCQLARALGVTTDEIGARAGLLRVRHNDRPEVARSAALEELHSVESLLNRARSGLDRIKKKLDE